MNHLSTNQTSLRRLHSPLAVLAMLGALSLTLPVSLPASAQVDTSKWKCETCPYPKGTSGTIEAGLGTTTEDSRSFGDYTGLDSKGAHLVLGGTLSHRSEGGYYAALSAADLGLDTRSISGLAGREGLYAVRFGYDELPRWFGDGARTPFAGIGGTTLTLPAGFPAATTGAMPLGSTLKAVDAGYKRQRFDLGGAFLGGKDWTLSASFKRDVRDGTRPLTASFFSTAAQLAAPIDQVTDQLELKATFRLGKLNGQVAYQLSQFSNDADSLTWANPFNPVVAGATRGQLALAPDNQFQQIAGSATYEISPTIRASGELAVGKLTQNEAFLASTLTPGLAATIPALPAQSLDGDVDTFHGSVRVTASPMPSLRLAASYVRDVRDNGTAVRAYPLVATDIFNWGATRNNTPFDLAQDRARLSADWAGPDSLRLAGGVDYDQRERNYHEAVTTRETTVWARAKVQPLEQVGLTFKAAFAERDHSGYGVAYWFGAPENPLMRKYQLAERRRTSGGLRADLSVAEGVAIGLAIDHANDEYQGSIVGLTGARSTTVGVDFGWSPSERTNLAFFAQAEEIRSRQAGSAAVAAPDWFASSKDQFQVVGISIKHAAIPDKLDLGLEVSSTRALSDQSVTTVLPTPGFPTGRTLTDVARLFATYKLSDQLSITGSWWYQSVNAQDWHVDGVQPATVYNLLSFGQGAPNYQVNVLRVAVRYSF